MKYFLTYHAVERLKERFSDFYNKHPELKKWSREKGVESVKKLFDDFLSKSNENKSYINNTMYMLKLYEKYGYDTEYCFKEYEKENILFILTKNRSDNHYKLVTLMPTEYRPSVKNIKYNNKQKKEDKHMKFVMDWYENLNVENKKLLKNNLNPIIECSSEIRRALSSLVVDGKTEVIRRLSNSKTLHSVIYNNTLYEFIYGKTNNGSKEIQIQKIEELSIDCINKEKYQDFLDFELKKNLLMLVHNNQTQAEKISNTKSLHVAQWNGLEYTFLYQKTPQGDRKITLEKEPIQIQRRKCKM